MMIISTSEYDPLRVPVTVQHDMDEDEYPSGYVEQLEATNAELEAEIERLTEENKRLVERSNWLNKQKEDMIEYQRHRERVAWQALEKLGGIPPKETP